MHDDGRSKLDGKVAQSDFATGRDDGNVHLSIGYGTEADTVARHTAYFGVGGKAMRDFATKVRTSERRERDWIDLVHMVTLVKSKNSSGVG